VAFVLGVAGIQAWRHWKTQQSQQAAAIFGELEEAATAGDAKKTSELAGRIRSEFGRTGYGARAALVAAKSSFDAGKPDEAADWLAWAADNAKDLQTEALAALRLAGVRLDQKKYPEALQALERAHPEPFAALFADARGDVLVAQGKPDEARKAYQVALDKLPKSSAYRNVVEIKRDALGGS
jgi:predicted negative regulator of RcsB-dependent stress response